MQINLDSQQRTPTLGFFYTVFNETEAVNYSISKLRSIYKTERIYLVSDGGLDFSYLKSKYENILTTLDVDTMSETFKINHFNFKEPHYQRIVSNCAKTLLFRLNDAINYLKTDYVLMMDPDTLVRGKLHIPKNAKLLGSRVNKGFPKDFKKIIKNVPGSIVINKWGATPGIFEVKSFLRARQFIIENWKIFEKLMMTFPSMYAHDVILPVMFSLIGIEETFNPEITECLRHKNWKDNGKPLLHQFRDFYPKDQNKIH